MDDRSAAPPPPVAVEALVEAVGQLEGLTAQVGPFALPSGTCDRAPEVTAAVCEALGVPLSFDAPPNGRPDHAAMTLGAGIRRAQQAPALASLSPGQITAHARRLRDEHRARFRRHTVRRPDATLVTVVETGPPDAPAVLLSPACAMNYRLALPWMRALGGSYRCLVMQTRGTSGRIDEPGIFDRRGYDVHDQAEDVMAVVETLSSSPVHLMGMCGGAVPALIAAAAEPDYFDSLSLWHADLELGPEAGKTDHQVNLRALLDTAGQSRASAAAIRELLVSSPMTGFPPGIGPLVVTPYAADELLYRYAKLVAATMHWDSRSTAAAVSRPTLVVTSRDDHTAHPDGSRRVAQILPDADLRVTDHGTHLDAFAATDDQVSLLTSFLRQRPATR